MAISISYCSRAKLFVLTSLLLLTPISSASELALGSPAPGFSLADQQGQTRTLAEFRGKWMIIIFYTKDDTPDCPREICSFRDEIPHLQELGAEILGVNMDNSNRNKVFSEKHGLQFPLLSDPGGIVARRYHSLWGAGPFRIARRHTFVIDPEGKIAMTYFQVTPATHSLQVIHDLQALQQATFVQRGKES